jgi:malate permease and related proteins
MANMAMLLSCFVLGVVLRQSGRLPENAPAALNGFIIHISLPAVILLHIHHTPVDISVAYPLLAPWVLFGVGSSLVVTAAKVARWSAPTTGGLILSASLANTSFLGLPMIEAFYGASFVGLGILIDQLGTYLVLSTLGIVVAAMYSSRPSSDVSVANVAQKVLKFTPLQALLLALVLRPIDFPADLQQLLGRLGATLAPLALVSVGYQLRLGDFAGRLAALTLGLFFKLVLGPILIAVMLVKILGTNGPTIQVTIFEAAMAPQIGAAIVAMEHKLDPPLVTLMVGIGIPLSFLTLPLWWYVLQGV